MEATAARVREHLGESAAVTRACLDEAAAEITAAAHLILAAVEGGGKVLLFGNGGSAADAQHLAADLVGRFRRDRAPIPAVALAADAAVVTAVGNDFGFEQVFARQVEALAVAGDVAVILSTSGRSPNVVAGAGAARRAGARVITLTGRDGGALARLADIAVRVPSGDVARIQEAHIAIGHAICAVVEDLRPGGGTP